MAKSLDPKNINYVAAERDFYFEEVISYRDGILIRSEYELIEVTASLKDLKLSLESGTPTTTIPALKGLQDFYVDADSFFPAEHDYDDQCAPILRARILEVIAKFILVLEDELKEENSAQKQQRIKDGLAKQNKIEAGKAANVELSQKRQQNVAMITDEKQIKKREKKYICSKLKEDSDLCLYVLRLRNKIENFVEVIEEKFIKDKNVFKNKEARLAACENALIHFADVREVFNEIGHRYISILSKTLGLDVSDMPSLTFASLKNMQRHLDNIFQLFSDGMVTLGEFNTDYDQSTKWYALEAPTEFTSVALAGDEEKRLSIALCKEFWEKTKDHSKLEGELAEQLMPIFIRIKLLKILVIKHNLPLAIFNSWGNEFLFELSHLTSNDNDKTAEFEEFVKLIAEYNKEQNKIDDCISIKDIFKFSQKMALKILKMHKELGFFCKITGISLKQILSLDESVLEVWLANKDFLNLSRIKILITYFFVPKQYLLSASAEHMQELIDDPQHSIITFNAQQKPYTTEDLRGGLINYLDLARGFVKTLRSSGYFFNLSKLDNSSRDLIELLQQIGLSFHQCKALYEIMTSLNHSFCANYAANETLRVFHEYRIEYEIELGARFSVEERTVIRELIEPYYKFLLETLDSRDMKLSPKFEYVRELVINEDQTVVEKLEASLKDRITEQSLLPGNVSIEHFALYRYLMVAGLDVDAISVIAKIHNIFADFDQHPNNDIGNAGNSDENALFRAIHRKKIVQVQVFLQEGFSPLEYNCKNISCLASTSMAVCESDISDKTMSVYKLVRERVIKATASKLNTFLFANKIANTSPARQLAFAINAGEDEVVQALIARGANLAVKFEGKTLLELAANSPKAKREFIINEVKAGTMLQNCLQQQRDLEVNADKEPALVANSRKSFYSIA